MSWDDFDITDYEDERGDDIDCKTITHLYQLRHAYNLYGNETVAEEMGVPKVRINALYYSNIHGSTDLQPFIRLPDEEFKNEFKKCKREANERERSIEEVRQKNENLINDLKKKRKLFAGIGTNKAKRRLNKLALTSPLAKAIRLALEIEDKSISAKNSYREYQNRIYYQKTLLILDLCELFKQQKWIYGVQESSVPAASHVIYFEIPTCEQISWHFTPEKSDIFPVYARDWDGKENSTIRKLEVIAEKLLKEKT